VSEALAEAPLPPGMREEEPAVGRRWALVGVLVLMGTGWGATQPLAKIAVSTGHGFMGLIFWQVTIGAVLLGGWLAARGRLPVLTRRRAVFATVIALIGTVLPNSSSYVAYPHLPAGIMAIVIATVPLMAFPIALWLRVDRIGAGRLGGLGLGILGVVLIAGPEGALPAGGAAWLPVALIAPLFYAVEGNYVARNGTEGMDAAQAMFLASVVGVLVSAPLALGLGQFIDPFAGIGLPEAALIGSSIIHTLAYASYVWLAARAGAVFAAQTSYIVTGTGVLWAMLMLGERFAPVVWAALAVMLAGVAMVQPRRAVVERVEV
jgi:drug/metabolite transporter (DMT)-like permease